MDVVKHYIDTFNKLNNKTVTKERLRLLLEKVKREKQPGLNEVEAKLTRVIAQMNGKPIQLRVTPVTLPVVKAPEPKREIKKAVPPAKRKANNQVVKVPSVVKEKPVRSSPVQASPTSKNVKALNGVVDAQAIKQLIFSRIELDGKYKDAFLKMFSDNQIMVWGPPGHGKTVWLLEFAQYLAEKKNKNVLFIANEEMNRSTLTEKLIRFNIGHKKLMFAKNLNSLTVSGMKIEDFDAIFFDSIQSLGFTLESYKKFVEEHPGRIYVPIVQSTKDGDFRGGKDWEHEVDIAGEIRNRKLILRKNRLDEKFAEKSDKLSIQEQVIEGKKRHQIKEQIKKSVKVEQPQPVVTV